MRLYFEAFGAVKETIVMRDRETQRSRGFGFVTFHRKVDADSCKAKPGHNIDDRAVEVKDSTPVASRSSGPPPGAMAPGGAGGQYPAGDRGTKKIFVGGLPKELTDAEMT